MYKQLKFLIVIVVIVIALSCSLGCQNTSYQNPSVEKNGRLCGVTKGLFRHRWWNYYERGESFQDCQLWEKAEADFRQAIAGWHKDERRARTYGMHFIDYFPHRELGVSLFYQKRYDEAIEELEISLKSENSAKAEFYLDKTRNAKIKQDNLDKKPPDISINSPKHESSTNQSSIMVSGLAHDDTFVKTIKVNEKNIRIDLSAPSIPFKTNIPLKTGLNAIIVEAVDITGKTKKIIQNLICDRTGPVLNIEQLIPVKGIKKFLIKGSAFDNMGIKQIKINGKTILQHAVPEAILNHPVTLSKNQDQIVIIAEDMAGNLTCAKLPISKKSHVKLYDFHENMLLASLDNFPMLLFLKNKNTARYYAAASKHLSRSKQVEKRFNKQINKYQKAGNYYGLIIGINQYEHWPVLNTAVNDANSIYNILIKQYGFLQDNIILITDKDATGASIIKALRHLAVKLGENDNLLIYYAGHGLLDPLTEKGYWMPQEASQDDPMTWISNHDIRDILSSEKVRGKNILVIADSCYSGSLLRGIKLNSIPVDNENKKILELASKKSRQVIASGGLQPVADGGRDNHSLFAYYLLKALEENESQIIDMETLFTSKVKMQVIQMGSQRPTMGRLRTLMDEDGQFILVKQNNTQTQPDKANFISHEVSSIKPSLLTGINRTIDHKPPIIELKRWQENQTVFMDEIYIGGHVSDETGISSIDINGQKLLRKSTKNVYFHYLTKLKTGNNPFVIESKDKAGNTAKKEINIHKKVQEIYDTGSRMAVVQFPFIEEGPQTSEVKNILRRKLTKTERFNMKKGLLKTDEQKDPDKIRNFVRKMNGDFWLEGRIIKKKKSLEISAGIYEIEESDILTEQEVYGEDLTRESIENMCQGLVIKLRDEFPQIEGKVIKVKGNKIMINRGRRDGIKKGMLLIIFQEGDAIIDPDTNEVLEEAEIDTVTTARIKQVREKISNAQPIDKYGDFFIKPGLKIVMK